MIPASSDRPEPLSHMSNRNTGRRGARLLALAGSVSVACALVQGCASKDPNRSGLLQPYRLSIPQGNYVTKTQLDQVKPGMSRDQVRFALGTPLVQDIFHPKRWDYVFSYRHANGRVEQRGATVIFGDDDKVARVEDRGLPERDDPTDPALPGARLRPQTSK